MNESRDTSLLKPIRERNQNIFRGSHPLKGLPMPLPRQEVKAEIRRVGAFILRFGRPDDPLGLGLRLNLTWL